MWGFFWRMRGIICKEIIFVVFIAKCGAWFCCWEGLSRRWGDGLGFGSEGMVREGLWTCWFVNNGLIMEVNLRDLRDFCLWRVEE